MSSTVTDRIQGLSTSVAMKAPVKDYTTGNITRSGLGVQAGGNWGAELNAGDRILVKDQADTSENGIYVADTSDWNRSEDFNGRRDVAQGTLVSVGNTGKQYRVVTPNPIAIGTTGISFAVVPRDDVEAVDSIYDLMQSDPSANPLVLVSGYHSDSDVGGGRFYWAPSEPKANHNGVTIFSPTVPWDGSTATLSDFLAATGETDSGGAGCWIRSNVESLNIADAGADVSGSIDSSPSWRAALPVAVASRLPVLPHPGAYKITSSVNLDDFSGLYISGRGQVTIDFQTGDAFKFGDFTIDGSGYFTQTSPTVSDIIVEGIKFIPSDNGWDGSTFAYPRPLAFSAAENVTVRDCLFRDNHVGAVDFSARSKDLYIYNNSFESTEEADTTYGPRPFCYVAPLINYDSTTGLLTYSEPTVYHENVNIYDNTFVQIGRGIVSWNVHRFNYHHNYFVKPLIRTISATNWSVEGSIHHNTHVAQDNSVETLSTFVNIGTGSRKIKVHDEKFIGNLSGTGINSSLKCVDCGGASRLIEVYECEFDTVNMQVAVNVGPNVEIDIKRNKFMQDVSGAALAPIVLNEGAASSPGFNFPRVNIEGNTDYANNRFVNIVGEPPGTPEPIRIFNNDFTQIMSNRIAVINAASSAWSFSLWGNRIPVGAFNYVDNLGSGGRQVLRADTLERRLVTINTTGSAVSLNWREYGGDEWYIVPDVSQTITGITGALADGQVLRILTGGSITFPNGANFRLEGGVDANFDANDAITFVSRAGIWFEASRARTS